MAISSGRFGTAEYGGALYGVNPAWRVESGSRWDFIVQTCPRGSVYLDSRYDGGEPLTDLLGASGVKATFRLAEPSTLEWSLPHTDPACEVIQELAVDVVAWRNGVRLDRFRVGSTSDELDTDAGRASFSAVDYRAVLDRRILDSNLLGSTHTWTQVDQGEMVWRLVQIAQRGNIWGEILSLPSGRWLGLSQGAGATTGRLRDRTYHSGQNIGQLIRQLSEVIDGFDWSISPTGVVDVHYPRRGVARDFVAHWGANVARIRRTVDTSTYATVVRQSGAEGVNTAVAGIDDDIDRRPQGGWHHQSGDPDITDTATLQEKADGELARRGQLLPSYVLTLSPGVWDGPETLWLGDTIRLVARSGYRLDVDTEVRVVEIAVTVGDDGGETVELTCDRPHPDMFRSTAADRFRLTSLERR